MSVSGIRRNFSGGEVAATIASRDDLAKYATSCRQMQNFVPQLHGGARYRTGFELVAELGGYARLLPFAFNTDDEDTYVMVFEHQKFTLIQDGGQVLNGDVVYHISTPYTADQIDDLIITQSADVVYIAHPAHVLYKLKRTGHTSWSLAPVSLQAPIQPPSAPSVSWSGDTGNYTIRFRVTAVDTDGRESVGSDIGSKTNAKYSSDWTEGNYATVSWSAVTGAEEYNIYKEDKGVFGYVGTSTTTTFRDDNFVPDPKATVQEHKNPFEDDNNPVSVALHKQRLWVSGTSKKPTTLYASRIGDYENFNKSRPLQADDALELTIASGSLDRVEWAKPFGDLMVGSTGAEYRVFGASKGDQVTTTEQNLKAESYWGSASVQPIVIGNSILHVTRLKGRVRDLFWSLEKDGYAGNDLSILAAHLFDGRVIENWTYQQEPDSVLFAVRSDGVGLGLAYLKEHEIWGWFRVVTNGKFRNCCSIPNNSKNEDSLYVVVERTINGQQKFFVERLKSKWRGEDGLENANYLDCSLSYKGVAKTEISGLEHLNGEMVSVFADGNVVEGLTVADGKITLPSPASDVHVGFAYTGILEPLPIEMDLQTGSTQGQMRGIGQVTLRLYESVGGQVGSGTGVLNDIKYFDTVGDMVEPFTGVVKQSVDASTSESASIKVVQNRPRPMTVLAIIEEISQ